jgi:hypothetical protein
MKKLLLFLAVILTFAACQQNKTNITLKEHLVKDSTEKCVISYKLPYIYHVSGKYSKLCEKINADLKSKMDEMILPFKTDAYDFYKEFVTDAKDPSAIRYEYYGAYDLFFADAKTISYRYSNYQYTGGAHGNATYDAFNYDLQQKKNIKLSDVVKTNDEAIVKLNKLLVKYFKNTDKCFDLQPEIKSDYKYFNIQKESIIFTFHAYELGAYACGSPSIEIPIQELKEEGLYIR